jgi:G3E family GTPase
MRQVPVLLLTGFLGSGKTTFLNWLIYKHPEKKVSVIVNEFGDVKLESQFIEKKEVLVTELPSGCMCCVAKSDIPHTILFILDNAPLTEYILIEASGLSDPEPIREVLTSPMLAHQIFFDKTITIVDAENFDQTKEKYPIIMNQIADSELILISKLSRTTKENVEVLINQLKKLTDTPILEITDDLNPDLFLTKLPRPITDKTPLSKKPEQLIDYTSHHSHEDYDSLWFESEKSVNLRAFETVMHHLPNGIVRAKGLIQVTDEEGESRKLLVQYVNGRVEIQANSWEPGQKKQTALIFLGKNFDRIELNTRLDACLV